MNKKIKFMTLALTCRLPTVKLTLSEFLGPAWQSPLQEICKDIQDTRIPWTFANSVGGFSQECLNFMCQPWSPQKRKAWKKIPAASLTRLQRTCVDRCLEWIPDILHLLSDSAESKSSLICMDGEPASLLLKPIIALFSIFPEIDKKTFLTSTSMQWIPSAEKFQVRIVSETSELRYLTKDDATDFLCRWLAEGKGVTLIFMNAFVPINTYNHWMNKEATYVLEGKTRTWTIPCNRAAYIQGWTSEEISGLNYMDTIYQLTIQCTRTSNLIKRE